MYMDNVRKRNFDEYAFAFQLLFVVLVTFFETMRMERLAEVALIGNFGLALVLAISAIFKRFDIKIINIWFLIVSLSLLSVYLTVQTFTFDYMKSWIMFMITICLYFWVSSIEVTEGMIKNIFRAGIMIAFLFVFLYFSDRAYNTDNRYVVYANFGLTNTNLAGIYLLNIFLCMLIYIDFIKKKISKFFFRMLAGLLLYFIYLTQARSCMIAAIACLLFKFLPFKKPNALMTFIVILFPLAFVGIYLSFIDSDFMNFFEFASGVGKELDSRVGIWTRKLTSIKKNLLFGDYYNENGNAHNIYLAVLSSHGVLVCTLLIAFLNDIVNKVSKNIVHKYQYMAILAFYAVIISGTFEAALFTGSQGMYVFSGGFLMIAKFVSENFYKEDNELAVGVKQ